MPLPLLKQLEGDLRKAHVSMTMTEEEQERAILLVMAQTELKKVAALHAIDETLIKLNDNLAASVRRMG